MINAQFLATTKCLHTGQSLHLAPDELVERINRSIREQLLRNQLGDAVMETVEQALVNDSKSLAYPLRGGILIMLKDEAIDLGPLSIAPDAVGDGTDE